MEQSILKQINYFDEIKKGEKSYIEIYEKIAYDIDKKRQENINLYAKCNTYRKIFQLKNSQTFTP